MQTHLWLEKHLIAQNLQHLPDEDEKNSSMNGNVKIRRLHVQESSRISILMFDNTAAMYGMSYIYF